MYINILCKKKGMKNMMNEMKMGVYTYITDNGEESNSFKFHTNLSYSQKVKFVDSVVDILIDDTHYNSVIRNLIFDFFVIDIMTDIDTTEFKKSENFLDDVENFLLSTNIVEIVEANAFPTLFDELNKAVDKSIAYRTGIHPSPLSDALSSLVNTIEKKINEIDTDSMKEMANIFSNMTGEITPESIVDAYMKSDMHKQNLTEIAEAKKPKSKTKAKTGAKSAKKTTKKVETENKSEDKTETAENNG